MLPLAIPAIMGGVKAVSGIAGIIKNKKIKKNAVDPGVISKEEKDAVASAKQRALGGLPTDKLALEAIQRNKANTMNAITKGGSSKNVLAAQLASQGQAGLAESKEIAKQGDTKLKLDQTADTMDASLGAKRQANEQKKYTDTIDAANKGIQTNKENLIAGATDIAGAGVMALGGATSDPSSKVSDVANASSDASNGWTVTAKDKLADKKKKKAGDAAFKNWLSQG